MEDPLVNKNQIAEFNHSVIYLRSDGIVEIDCADDTEYDVEDIKQNLECIQKIAAGKKVLVLNNAGEYTTVSKEAREYIGSGPHRDFIAAEAFVIRSLGQLILGNLFMKVNKPIVPAKLFKTKWAAEHWLKSFE
ncbi:MAG TPA: hypothetical protein VN026_15110 [Bacteroidia bacterium]|jgi:hypothetical protein|nr:hypothetical protein [Bacteroidia bacterium]